MSGPARWKDGHGGASDEVRALLSAGPKPRGMSAHERSEATRQAAKIAALPVGALAWWGSAKALAAGLATVAVVAVGTGVVVHRTRAAPTRAVTAPTGRARVRAAPPSPVVVAPTEVTPIAATPTVTAVVVAPRAAAARPLPIVTPRPAPTRDVPTPPAPSAAPPRDESLTAETALLVRARRELEGDPATALELVDRHSSFMHAALAEERELIAVMALQRLGRRVESRARGEALIARWPTGTAASRVRGLLSDPERDAW